MAIAVALGQAAACYETIHEEISHADEFGDGFQVHEEGRDRDYHVHDPRAFNRDAGLGVNFAEDRRNKAVVGLGDQHSWLRLQMLALRQIKMVTLTMCCEKQVAVIPMNAQK